MLFGLLKSSIRYVWYPGPVPEVFGRPDTTFEVKNVASWLQSQTRQLHGWLQLSSMPARIHATQNGFVQHKERHAGIFRDIPK